MTSLDEALRALEKAVELVAKATPGDWHPFSYKDDHDELTGVKPANKSDVADCSINSHRPYGEREANAKAIAAAVNFIREHGAAILSARQEVAPVVEYQVRPRGWTEESGWRKVTKRDFDDHGPFPGYPDSEWERRCLYTSPAQTSEARDAFIRDVAAQKPEKPDYWNSCGQCQHNIETAQELIDDAAMRQEGSHD